ncbi:MAG: phospholipase/Carboxylesterase family protein, partial [Alphaproteobacteria bacterium]|nr:phospholipase/Carboxylesterase family protein [Alphaproteobacteria bacterium]
MELQPIDYEAHGQRFTGWLADGSGGVPAPGILVAHEGGGLTDHAKGRALKLAGLGHVAFALDLFGEPDAPLERAREIVRQLRGDVGMLRARAAAALAILQAHPHVDQSRLGAIGFCFGGATVVELARTGAPLAALVGFHAGVLPGSEADDRAIRARVLLCHGHADPVVPVPQIIDFVEGLERAGTDWQLHLYGGVGHSFTNIEIDSW